MEIGTSIFLSSILISFVILFVSTKDRWNWGMWVKRALSLAILIGLVSGSWLGYEYYMEEKKINASLEEKRKTKFIESECFIDEKCKSIHVELLSVTKELKKLEDEIFSTPLEEFKALSAISFEPNYSKPNYSIYPYERERQVKVKNNSNLKIYELNVLMKIVERDREEPWFSTTQIITFNGGLLPGESRMVSARSRKAPSLPDHVISNLGKSISINYIPFHIGQYPSSIQSHYSDRDFEASFRLSRFEKRSEIEAIRSIEQELRDRKEFLESEYSKMIIKIKSQMNINN